MTDKQLVRDGLNVLVRDALRTKGDVRYYLQSGGNINLKYDGASSSITINMTVGGRFVAQYVPTLDEDTVTDAALDCLYSLRDRHERSERGE